MKSAHRQFAVLPAIAGDTALTLVAALFATLHLITVQAFGHRGQPGNWALALSLLCASSLLLRSRWPLAMLVAVGSLGSLYLAANHGLFPILPTVLIAFYSAAAHSRRPRPLVWGIAIGVGIALNLTNVLASGDNAFRFPSGVLLDSGWMLIALLLGEALRGRHALAHEAELRALEAERTQQEEAQRRVVEERLRIARELHDILAHTVALINVQAGVAAHVLDEQPEQAREALIHIKTASRATLQELRSLVGVLREDDTPAPLAPASGLEGLDGLIGTVRDAGLAVEVDDRRTNGPLPAVIDVTAYRILQESLTNAIKYAGRASVQVTVQQEPAALALEVTNSDGADSPAVIGGGSGHGIQGMRERAAALGGSLEAGPTPDGGFRVRARLPLPGGST